MKTHFSLFRKAELHYAQGKEFYCLPLNNHYSSFGFREIARDILYRSKHNDVLLIGYIRFDKDQEQSLGKQFSEMCLYPDDQKDPWHVPEKMWDKLGAHPTVLGIFIASDEGDIRQRQSPLLPMLPKEDSSDEEVDGSDVDIDSEEEEKQAQEAEAVEKERQTAAERLAAKLAAMQPSMIPPDYHFIEKPTLKRKEAKASYRIKVIEKQLSYLKKNELGIDTIYDLGRKAYENRYVKNSGAMDGGKVRLHSGENNLPLQFEGNHFLYCIAGDGAIYADLDLLVENLILGLEEPDENDIEEKDEWMPSDSSSEDADAFKNEMLKRRSSVALSESADGDSDGRVSVACDPDTVELDALMNKEEKAAAPQKPKRKKLTQVVLVVLSQKKPVDWNALGRFQTSKVICIWICGNPTKQLDLERCSFRLARAIFVTSTPDPPLDGQGLFTTRLIEYFLGTDFDNHLVHAP